MPKLSRADVEAFLDERHHLLRIATLGPDGFPSLVPVWFVRRERDLLFTPRAGSAFLAHIRRDPRVAVSIDEDLLPYRKVTVQGVARVVFDVGQDDEWRGLYREIAKRYIADDAADAYVDGTIDQPRALIAVGLDEPSRTTSWRMPVEGEDGTGIWHRRYYGDGTLMARLADQSSAPPS
jgi:PPOX class probable F420-dependent enzyme